MFYRHHRRLKPGPAHADLFLGEPTDARLLVIAERDAASGGGGESGDVVRGSMGTRREEEYCVFEASTRAPSGASRAGVPRGPDEVFEVFASCE